MPAAKKRLAEPDAEMQDDLFAQDIPAPPAAAPSRFDHHVTVALDVPVDRLFTYGVAAGLAGTIRPGGLVKVRFAGRPMIGLVMEVGVDPPAGVRIMPVLGAASPTYNMAPEIRELARWIGHRWFCPVGESVRCAAFVGFQDVGQRLEEWAALTIAGREVARGWQDDETSRPGWPHHPETAGFAQGSSSRSDGSIRVQKVGRLSHPMKAVLRRLAEAEKQAGGEVVRMRVPDLVEEGVASRGSLLTLARRGWVTLTQQPVIRDHESLRHVLEPDPPRNLRPAQQRVLETLLATLAEPPEQRSVSGWLLHGVTGSGKTEIYLRAAARALEDGGTVLMLVPEISLTPQAVDRFRARLGPTVGVYHSRMTLGQKIDLLARIEMGDCRVIVGARSGVFAPLKRLRLIVVDEEHEQSYKQDGAPRYHGREVALERGRREGALVVLGSATPSMESYHQVRTGRLALLELPERVDGRALPPVNLVDLTAEAKAGRPADILSHPLQTAMETALQSGQQVLLFLNRRGYFNFAVCLACQENITCPHCDATLTHHRTTRAGARGTQVVSCGQDARTTRLNERLTCHFCGHTQGIPRSCPKCQNPEVALLGMGTQRIESTLRDRFPGRRVLRIDADTMKKRTAYLDAWRQIEQGEFDILVGTQVVAKGLHLEGITVVGVPLADGSLFQPDFRSAERAFSLLTQVAGRAGRGTHPGVVYLQTYVPRHYALQFAQTHDYLGFYEREIQIRESLRFPPLFHLVTLLLSGPDASLVKEAARAVAWHLREASHRGGDQFQVLGPAPAPLTRLQDHWRWRILVRTPDHELVHDSVVRAVEAHRAGEHRNAVDVQIDADPYDLS